MEESSLPIGTAAAESIDGAVVMTGVTLADVKMGLDGTRHGWALAELFASVLRRDKEKGVTLLMIAVHYKNDDSCSLNAEEIEDVVEEILTVWPLP